MARRPNQVSMPNPEFGVDFDASARAMHQSASKGSLMVHEKAFSMPAVLGKFLGATRFERKQMLKTLKSKIALVAVAGLGFGLVSTVPAFAANLAANTGTFSMKPTGNDKTADVDLAANTSTYTATTRQGATLSVYKLGTFDDVSAGAGSKFRAKFGTTLGDWVTYAAAATTATVVVPAGITGATDLEVVVDPDGNTANAADQITIASDVTFTVVDSTAPKTVSFASSSLTHVSATAADVTLQATVKDANGLATILLDNEAILVDVSPITGATATQVVTATAANAAASSFGETLLDTGKYPIVINGDGDADENAAADSGTTLSGTTYTLTAQLVDGVNAIGAPVSTTYTRLANTASLAGALSFVSSADTTVSTSSVTTATGIASTAFKVKAVNAAGGPLFGATAVLSVTGVTGTFANGTQTTAQDGITGTGITFTPDAGQSGSGTITATITTGSGSIAASVPLTVQAYGTTDAAASKTAAVNVNGTGWKAGIAPAYAASRNVTSIKVTISGLDASKAVLLDATTGTATGEVCDAGNNPIASAAGVIETTCTLDAPADGATFILNADTDGAAGDATVKVVEVTFADAAPAVTTDPANATSSFAAPGATVKITSTVANQFGAAVTGGVVVFTNTSKPAAATAQTAKTVVVGGDGKASFDAVLGTATGTYVYTANAKDVNGANISADAAKHTSTITFVVTASGAPKTLEVTSGLNTATTFYRVIADNNGSVDLTDAAAGANTTATTTTVTTANSKGHTAVVITVKDDAGAGVANVNVTATPGAGVLVNSANNDATTLFSDFNEATDLTIKTGVGGTATFYVTGTKVGKATISFKAGSATVSGEFNVITNSGLDAMNNNPTARYIKVDKATAAVSGTVVQIIATATDIWGNPVKGVELTGAIAGTAGRFTGGGRTQAAIATDANGQVVFEVTSNGTEVGTGTLTVAAAEATLGAGTKVNVFNDDITGNGAIADLVAKPTSSATVAITATAAAAAANPEIATVKADVKAVSDTVATLSKAVTTIQSSVTELTSSFSAQIKSLSSAIAKISRAIAALSKKIK